MRTFNVPQHFKSEIIAKVKKARQLQDPSKKDFSPTKLNFGKVTFWLARHFGFCYGVENAIERAYNAIEKYPDKRIFFLSEMIHNPIVNADLKEKGIDFLMDTKGNQLISWDTITQNDVVLIPAFGTTLKQKERLNKIGLLVEEYDTTCPFVSKVWNRSQKIAQKGFTIIVHGKPYHEETKATFSHAAANGATLIVKNMEETILLADFIQGKKPITQFWNYFKGRTSESFDPKIHLDKLGVVNQTTMLAEDTRGIAQFLKATLAKQFGIENIKEHFADTRDTLCYATNDNQTATYHLLEQANADIAFVIGGYNSSNTSHLVELCEEKMPTYFISSAKEIESETLINHFDLKSHSIKTTTNFLPQSPCNIIITSGASCPDTLLEEVMMKLLSFYQTEVDVEMVLKQSLS